MKIYDEIKSDDIFFYWCCGAGNLFILMEPQP
jgi:hypothetical protein